MKINTIRLNEIMREQAIDVKELADKSGVNLSIVYVLKSGTRGCSFKNAMKIAKALEVDFFELVPPEILEN